MAKLLSASALAQYHRDGFYVPIRVLSREEAAGYRRRLETYEAERGGALGGALRHKTHLLLAWLDRLVRHARLLEAGSMSLHHVLMFHSSPPNRSADRRIGYAIRYIPTYVRQVAGDGDSALLVRGVDEYHHFEPEEPPVTDLAPDAVARHAEIMKRQAEILYRGTGIDRFTK